MTLTELALIFVYTCALVVKVCDQSSQVCRKFGFGDSAKGKLAAKCLQAE